MYRILAIWCVSLIASATSVLACTPEAYGAKSLSQDWNEQDRAEWYGLSQGSRLIPMSWYASLRLANDGTHFSERGNQMRYASRFCDETDLPIGFVIDETEGRAPALGLTCAACHTGVLNDGEREFIVEGGSSDLDLQTYMADMFAGLEETYRDAGPNPGLKWVSFSSGVLGDGFSADENLALETEVRDWLQRRYQIQESIEAGGDWGHGRTDAVAVILNTATVLSGQRAGVTLPPSSAPTSFPHVWNAPQMQRVQWNGSATKVKDIGLFDTIEMGAMLRNLSEVLGVFAEIELTTDQLNDPSSYPSIRTSAKLANLVKLERTLETLKSPSWPAEWGSVDKDGPLYQRGAELYSLNCASCHSTIDRDDLQVRVWDSPLEDAMKYQGPFTKMVPVFDMTDLNAPSLGTDPLMACNALTHTSWTGKFELLHNSFDALQRLTYNKDIRAVAPDKFEKGTVTLRLIEELALRMTYEKRDELRDLQNADLDAKADAFFTGLKEGIFGKDPGREVDPASIGDRPKEGTQALRDLDAVILRCAEFLTEEFLVGNRVSVPSYKARPLNGIFASAPYLHNGSVPTLDDMLKPSDVRPEAFMTGRVRYDRAKMGLGGPLENGPVSEFKMRDKMGRIIPGNYNGGHNYAPSDMCRSAHDSAACEADRAAVLEYLKTL